MSTQPSAHGRHVAVNFHGLGTPHTAVAEDERPFWLPLERFEQILGRIARSPYPARFVVTFDDGNASDMMAADALARRGMTGRFYVLAGRIGRPGYLSAADLRSLVRGGMIVGLHGRDHLDWRRLDENALADELVGARHTIAAAAGRSVDEVAIPFGAYDRRVIRRLQEEGFARILTSDRGTFRPSARIWNRTSIRDDMTDAEIGAILSGHARPATRIRRAASRFARRHLR